MVGVCTHNLCKRQHTSKLSPSCGWHVCRQDAELLVWQLPVTTEQDMLKAERVLQGKLCQAIGMSRLWCSVTFALCVLQDDDIPGIVRYHTYEVLKQEIGNPAIRWAYLPYSMHMAGPREAIQHMIIRKNYGEATLDAPYWQATL